jgi:hypothetical protein
MKLLRSPAVHMLVIGGLLFGAAALRGRAFFEPRPQIVVAQHRLDLMLQAFVADHNRLPTGEEHDEMLDALIDEEVLYNYALTLGLYRQPVAERRLARIAEFVEANPHEAGSTAERAEAAMEMGLHHGDLVVRRILVDSARRLIRAVVLLQEPEPRQVEEYLAAHQDEFRRPARSRLSHVAVNGFKWPDTGGRARLLLARIRAESLDVDAAVALGDEAFVPAHLPPLTERALATKFGADFAAEVIAAPAGGWIGPIASRYGHHLVYVHERSDAYVPPLEEIRDSVRNRLLQELADERLALRLEELRSEYEIIAPERTS